ncbi:hypothetical protein R1flu_004770 [Riccia fluitans]|uniref:Uncharacterized protein n=1 Tax=Riccia fluitans TaxID=41844 RepID=A0ABD1YRS3_9MARC
MDVEKKGTNKLAQAKPTWTGKADASSVGGSPEVMSGSDGSEGRPGARILDMSGLGTTWNLPCQQSRPRIAWSNNNKARGHDTVARANEQQRPSGRKPPIITRTLPMGRAPRLANSGIRDSEIERSDHSPSAPYLVHQLPSAEESHPVWILSANRVPKIERRNSRIQAQENSWVRPPALSPIDPCALPDWPKGLTDHLRGIAYPLGLHADAPEVVELVTT